MGTIVPESEAVGLQHRLLGPCLYMPSGPTTGMRHPQSLPSTSDPQPVGGPSPKCSGHGDRVRLSRSQQRDLQRKCGPVCRGSRLGLDSLRPRRHHAWTLRSRLSDAGRGSLRAGPVGNGSGGRPDRSWAIGRHCRKRAWFREPTGRQSQAWR